MTIVIHNSLVHVYKCHVPLHETNDFHPLTMTRVYSDKRIYFTILKVVATQLLECPFKFTTKYMWLSIIRKNASKILLAKLYESKNVNVRVLAHHLFRLWKEDVLVDIDAFYKYEHFSVSIWPQCQITKTTLFYYVISCEAFIT